MVVLEEPHRLAMQQVTVAERAARLGDAGCRKKWGSTRHGARGVPAVGNAAGDRKLAVRGIILKKSECWVKILILGIGPDILFLLELKRGSYI